MNPLAPSFTRTVNEQALASFAQDLSLKLCGGQIIFLEGGLGAGKTTFVRCCLRALGYTGSVKSPSYSLVETYTLGQLTVQHFDWYRLDPFEDLDSLGLREYFSPDALLFIEWPERCLSKRLIPHFRIRLKILESQPQYRKIECTPSPI